MHIQPNSAARNKGGNLILEVKGPDCVHLWVKFSIQNVVLTVSRRTQWSLFSCVSTKPPLSLKISGCMLKFGLILFVKYTILNV